MGESSHTEKYKEMWNRYDSDDLRQRRFEDDAEERKNRRKLAVDKARDIPEEDSLLDEVQKMELDVDVDENEKVKKKAAIMDEWRQFLESSNAIDQRIGLSRISKEIHKNTEEVVKDLIEFNLFARIVHLLDSHGDRIVQLNCIYILTDATSYDVKDHIPLTIINTVKQILTAGTYDDCKRHSIALISNLTCDSIELRTAISTSGIVRHLVNLMPRADTRFLINITWFLANFMAGRGLIHTHDLKVLIIKALQTTMNHDHDDIIDYSCYGLRNICRAEKQNIHLVLELGCCPKLIELMFHYSKGVSTSAIKAVGEIIKGNDQYMQAALDGGVLPKIKETFQQSNEIKALSLWLLSNISAGNPTQIQTLIDSGLLTDTLKFMSTGNDQMKYEIAWIVLNMLNKSRVNQEQIEHVISLGWIQAICSLLGSKYAEILTLALKAMRAILHLENLGYIQQLGYYGAIALMNNLRSHTNEDVKKAAADVDLQLKSLEERGLITFQ